MLFTVTRRRTDPVGRGSTPSHSDLLVDVAPDESMISSPSYGPSSPASAATPLTPWSTMAAKKKSAFVTLGVFKAEATIKRKKKAEGLLAKTKDLTQPDFALAKPRIARGKYAYMLVPDAANGVKSDAQLQKRERKPAGDLVKWLNKNRRKLAENQKEPGPTPLPEWPASYEYGKPSEVK
jgi:hypothetical protein